MADNIARAIAQLLKKQTGSKDNGITVPHGLIHRYYGQRVVIHPTSSLQSKNWHRSSFLKLAHSLEKKGFEPVFVAGPQERGEWKDSPPFASLSDLARFLYESGYVIGNDSLIGHLASNLGVPTLIIADNAERMRLWKPGWFPGKVVTPPSWVPNGKLLRLREKYWQHFVTQHKVLSVFDQLARSV